MTKDKRDFAEADFKYCPYCGHKWKKWHKIRWKVTARCLKGSCGCYLTLEK